MKTIFRGGEKDKVVFHSSELIPYDIAQKGTEVMMKWKPETKYWINPGMVVAHRDKLSQKIYVERVLQESKEFLTGNLDDKTRKPETERKTRMIGIQCHFWEELED